VLAFSVLQLGLLGAQAARHVIGGNG